VCVHREDLVLHPKGRLSPRLDFVSFGEGQSKLSDTGKGITRHG